MSDVQLFTNPTFGSVRVVMQNDEPWFVGKDVAEALGYANTKDAILSHVDEEDRRIIQRSDFATFENHLPKFENHPPKGVTKPDTPTQKH